MRTLKKEGISSYLSCEPIFPVPEANPISIIEKTSGFVDLFEFGMWNKYRTQGIPPHYYEHYSDAYYVNMFKKITEVCEAQKLNYCFALHSKKLIEEVGLHFKPYPTVIPLEEGQEQQNKGNSRARQLSNHVSTL